MLSTTVTLAPNLAKTWPSSTPIGPPPSTIRDSGTSVTLTASRLVQNGVPARPGSGGTAGSVPDAITTPRRARSTCVAGIAGADQHRARARELPGAPEQVPAVPDEPLRRDGVVPVVGRLVPDPGRDGRPVWFRRGPPGQRRHSSCLGQHVTGAYHHLRRHASEVRAFPTDQPGLDASDVEAGLGEFASQDLPPGPIPMTITSNSPSATDDPSDFRPSSMSRCIWNYRYWALADQD